MQIPDFLVIFTLLRSYQLNLRDSMGSSILYTFNPFQIVTLPDSYC